MKPMSAIVTESTLTCPECGFAELLSMPTDCCQWYHECKNCGTLLRPNAGHCCVFCSFGSVACPPVQAEQLGMATGTGCARG